MYQLPERSDKVGELSRDNLISIRIPADNAKKSVSLKSLLLVWGENRGFVIVSWKERK